MTAAMIWPAVIMPSVYPSLSARATASLPRVPAAPGRFSMTTGWPSFSCNDCAMMRPMMSAPPPGPNGTMMRTGRCGHSCADAPTVLRSNPAADRAKSPRRVNIGVLPRPAQADFPAVVSAAGFRCLECYIASLVCGLHAPRCRARRGTKRVAPVSRASPRVRAARGPRVNSARPGTREPPSCGCGPPARTRAQQRARPKKRGARLAGTRVTRFVALTVDRQTERHAARERSLRRLLQWMKARALHVAKQPFETEPAEIAGTARGVEREIDGADRAAADQGAVDEDRIGRLR